MKTLLLTSALLIGAAPVLAQTQLERQLGVPAGKYTTSQLAELAAASNETGSDARVYFGNDSATRVSSRGVTSERAAEVFARFAREDDDSQRRAQAGKVTPTPHSSGAVNATAERILAQIKANSRSDE